MTHDEILDELPLGETAEIAPGVVVERRCFLTLASTAIGAAIGAVLLPAAAAARTRALGGERLSYEEFLKEVVPIAKKLVGDTSLAGQDHYLHTMASYAVRLAEVAVPEMREQEKGSRTFIGANPGGDPFVVLHWRMEPGSAIGYHPHIYGNVVTLGLEGETRIGNFEMIGERDFNAKSTFKVRKTHDQWLTPGQINLVNLDRDYIHGFQAGAKGARGLDITTRIREKKPTPALNLAKKPFDEAMSIYEATWTY